MPSGVCQAVAVAACRGAGFGSLQAMLVKSGIMRGPPISSSMRAASSRSQKTAPSVGDGRAARRRALPPALSILAG